MSQIAQPGRLAATTLAVALSFAVLSCSPELGSTAWCKKMDATSKGDWSANQAADYARHCILD